MSNDNYNSDFNRGYFGRKPGRLTTDGPQRAGGKKVFEWMFVFSNVDRKPVKVIVSLMGGMVFSASCAELAGVDLKHSDIQQLHAMTESALMDRIADISGIVWEDWYQIEVTGGRSDFADSRHSSWGSNLKINITDLKRGLHPVSGKPVTIGQHGTLIDFPESSSIDVDEQDVGDWRKAGFKPGRSCAERSYLPATPENTAALKHIIDQTYILRSKLAHVLNHDEIEKTVAIVNKSLPPLLAWPAGPGTDLPKVGA